MFLTRVVALITFLYGVCLFHLSLVKQRLECYGGGSMLALIPALEVMACVHYAKPKKKHEESLVLLLFCIDLAVAALVSEWPYMKFIATTLFVGIQVVGVIVFLDWFKQERATRTTTTCKALARALETALLNSCLVVALLCGFYFVHKAVLDNYAEPGLAFALFGAAMMSVVVNCRMVRSRNEKHRLILFLSGHQVCVCLTYAGEPWLRTVVAPGAWVYFGAWYYIIIYFVYRLYYEKRYGKTFVTVKRPIRNEEPNIDVEAAGHLLRANGQEGTRQTTPIVKPPSVARPSAPPLNSVE